jgi:hypothetical protein
MYVCEQNANTVQNKTNQDSSWNFISFRHTRKAQMEKKTIIVECSVGWLVGCLSQIAFVFLLCSDVL